MTESRWVKPGMRLARLLVLAGVGVVFNFAGATRAQEQCVRIMAQDSTLNNLVDPPGYATAPPGTLGDLRRMGSGPQAMILIPGYGFSAETFTELMESWQDRYTMYAVTLAGFGGTQAPPCPPESVSYVENTWTNGAVSAIEKLMESERIQQPILVGHWLGGTQVAARLAMRNPNQVKALLLLAGSPRQFFLDTAYAKYYATAESRARTVDDYWAPRWFKTVTRETWDDNNFMPHDYAVNPVRGLRLWREAARPLLHVWVRYLCEFNAQDLCLEIGALKTPTLLLKPGLEGVWHDASNYMDETYCNVTWDACLEANPGIVVKTIPNSRVCLWLDQPEAVDGAIDAFMLTVK